MALHKKILKWTISIILSLILLLLLLTIGTGIFLTTQNLNGLVEKYSSKFLNAEVKSDTISVHIFKHFPYLTFSMTNGEVISGVLQPVRDSSRLAIPAGADTLLKFNRIYISVSVTDLLRSKVNIRSIAIEAPDIYAFVMPDGTANYDIVKGSMEADTATTDSASPDLKIRRVGIYNGGHVRYFNLKDSMLLSVDLNRLFLRGNFTTDLEKTELDRGYLSKFLLSVHKLSAKSEFATVARDVADTLRLNADLVHSGGVHTSAKFAIDSLRMRKNDNHYTLAALTETNLAINNFTLIDDIPFAIEGAFTLNDSADVKRIDIDKLNLNIARLPVEFNGDLELSGDTLLTKGGFRGRVENFKLSEFLEYIPKEAFPAVERLKTDAVLNLDILMNGFYNFKTGELPSLTARLTVPKSSASFKGMTSRINEMEADIYAYYSATNKDSAAVEINKLLLKGRSADLSLDGKISRLASADPFVDVVFKGWANLDTLSRLFIEDKGSVCRGRINADLSIKSLVSNLNMYNIGNADIKGVISSDTTIVALPEKHVFTYLTGVHIGLGAVENKYDSAIESGMRMFATNTTADTIYINYKRELEVIASKFRIAGHNSADITGGEKKVHPLNGVTSVKRLDIKGPDSLKLRAKEAEMNFSILPYEQDYSIPHLSAGLKAKSLGLREGFNIALVTNGDIALEAIINNRDNKKIRERREAFLDSLQKRYPRIERDSLMPYFMKRMERRRERNKGDFDDQIIDFKIDNSLGAIIRRWKINGSINAKSGGLITPYMPLRTRLYNVNFKFNTDSLRFHDTKLRCGKSVMNFTGEVSGIRRALLRNGTIKIDGSIVSDSLNFNELISAMHRGSEIMKHIELYRDSLSAITSETQLEEAITEVAPDTVTSPLIIIPGNVNATLSMDIKKGRYSNLELREVKGEMSIRDRCLQIKEFDATTNAGEMDFSGFYATRSKKDLSTGFDLELKNVEIEKFVALMPDMDTLLPMLKSFEGLINCQIAATSQIDTAMNIMLPTLKGVARITGDNLVLMDGETFSMIAKKLKFKNRERNLIDRISVEMLVNENKIEVFPFLAEIDRYKFAISGTQNLDLSFNYHISVLHSPIPFRLGVTIFGNMDDFDFKIGRAKYKNENLPVYSTIIDSTRLNLRDRIANIYRIGIDAALRNSQNMARIQRLQREKEKFDSQYEAMDSLSAEEKQLYNAAGADTDTVTQTSRTETPVAVPEVESDTVPAG